MRSFLYFLRSGVCSFCESGTLEEVPRLEFGSLGGAGEGNDVADVGHAGDEEHQALEAEAEASMGAGAVAACVEIPPHVLHGDVTFVDGGEQFIVVLFANGASDDFANMGEEDIGALDGAAVVVLLHVESFDFFGVVDHDDRLHEVLFDEIAFVFAGKVGTPVNGEFELVAVFDGLFEDADTFGIGQTDEVGIDDALEAFDEAFVDHVVEEL